MVVVVLALGAVLGSVPGWTSSVAFRALAGTEASSFRAEGQGYSADVAWSGFDLVPAGSQAGPPVRVQFVGGRLASKGERGRCAEVVSALSECVRFDDVYAGIDVVYRSSRTTTDVPNVEFDFIVAPGVDPAAIRMRLSGVHAVMLDAGGDLVARTASGELRQRRPVAFQTRDGHSRAVAVEFELDADGEVSFRVGDYDPSLPLVIDPEILYSTFVGGSGIDHAYAVAVDDAMNAYVVGETSSMDLPIVGALQPMNAGGVDIFIVKYDPNGLCLFETYLGGSGDDIAYGVAFDRATGSIAVVGSTTSTDFPVANPFQPSPGGGLDGFVAVITEDGAMVESASYLGGSGDDFIRAVAADGSGRFFITGSTESGDFPTTPAPYQNSLLGLEDAIIAVVDVPGTLISSTYFGGTAHDQANAIAVDDAGNIFVAGQTDSPDLPTQNAFQPFYRGTDGFATKFDASISTLVFSTFLGGRYSRSDDPTWGAVDEAYAIGVDAAGNSYVVGDTQALDFPTLSPYQASRRGPIAGFVTKFDAAGAAVYSTYLGGQNDDRAFGVAVHASGHAAVYGTTNSFDFPLARALFSAPNPGPNRFMTVFNPNGDGLTYSSYSREGSNVGGVAIDPAGSVYLAGTADYDTPAQSACQVIEGGDFEGRVTVLQAVVDLAVQPSKLELLPAEPVDFELRVTNELFVPAQMVMLAFVVDPCLDVTGFDPAITPSQVTVAPGPANIAWDLSMRTLAVDFLVDLAPGAEQIIGVTGMVAGADDPALCCSAIDLSHQTIANGLTVTKPTCVQIGGCPGLPAVVSGVRAVRRGGRDVDLSWDVAADVGTASYNVWRVVTRDPRVIPVANQVTARSSPNLLELACSTPAASPACSDADAGFPTTVLYYQVRGACLDGREGLAHP